MAQINSPIRKNALGGSSSSYKPKPFGETAFSDLVDESALEAKLKGRIRQPTRSKKSRAEAKAAAFASHTEQLQRLINMKEQELNKKFDQPWLDKKLKAILE